MNIAPFAQLIAKDVQISMMTMSSKATPKI
jgi:hypothetical protein